MRIGASYYPELLPREDWKRDLATGRAYGLSCLRCGEFAWAAILRAPDLWDTGWIVDFMDLAHREGYAVIWCTPSASPPPAVFDRWPELQAVNCDSLPMPPGIRRNYCPSHTGYRDLSAQIASRLAKAIGRHPALLGWQVDNEIAGDGFTCWCDACARKFRLWLQNRYGTLQALNQAWQTGVWSQVYTRWEQIPLPHPRYPAHAPALRLAYRRFRSGNWQAFYHAQAEALRAHSAVPVSTNFYNYTWDVPFDLFAWQPELDAIGISHYLEDPAASRFQLALLNGLRTEGKPLWILEQKAGQQRAQNLLPDDEHRIGRHLRLCAEAGAEVAIYWPLRQHSAGCEQEHGAVLRHDGRPGRIARSIRDATIAHSATPRVNAAADRALVFSFVQHWANEQRPPLGSRWNYADSLALWHDAACELWGELRVCAPAAIGAAAYGEGLRVAIAPHLQLCEPEMCAGLLDFVRAGGTLLLTADCARLDEENNVLRAAPLAFLARLPELAGQLPELELLHPQTAGPDGNPTVRCQLNGAQSPGEAFWALPENGTSAVSCGIGAITCAEPQRQGPLALRLRFHAGSVILLMAKTGRPVMVELLRELTARTSSACAPRQAAADHPYGSLPEFSRRTAAG